MLAPCEGDGGWDVPVNIDRWLRGDDAVATAPADGIAATAAGAVVASFAWWWSSWEVAVGDDDSSSTLDVVVK